MLQGIIQRLTDGVLPSSNYCYFGFGDLLKILCRKDEDIAHLRLRGHTQARTLVARTAGLEDHKRFMVSIASNQVGNIERLVRVGLNHRDGIRGVLQRYDQAAAGLYKPKSFNEKDDLRALLLWKLGGNRIAGIAHRALGLPSVSTLCSRGALPPLVASHAVPTVEEVTKNIMSCFESILDVVGSEPVVHVNQMVDEIATEKRIQWDDSTNKFLGICREHSSRVSLDFSTIHNMEELFHSIKDGDVHHAGEV